MSTNADMRACLAELEAVMVRVRAFLEEAAGPVGLDRPRLEVITGTARRRTKPRGNLRLVG